MRSERLKGSQFLPAAGIFAARQSSGPSLQFGLRALETFGVNLRDTSSVLLAPAKRCR